MILHVWCTCVWHYVLSKPTCPKAGTANLSYATLQSLSSLVKKSTCTALCRLLPADLCGALGQARRNLILWMVVLKCCGLIRANWVKITRKTESFLSRWSKMEAEQGWLQKNAWEVVWRDVLCFPHWPMLPLCDLGALHCIPAGTKERQEAANVTAAYGGPACNAPWEFSWVVFLRCFPEMFSWECWEVSAGLEGSRWPHQVFVTWCLWHGAVLGKRSSKNWKQVCIQNSEQAGAK